MPSWVLILGFIGLAGLLLFVNRGELAKALGGLAAASPAPSNPPATGNAAVGDLQLSQSLAVVRARLQGSSPSLEVSRAFNTVLLAAEGLPVAPSPEVAK